jgi:hypothetical protein
MALKNTRICLLTNRSARAVALRKVFQSHILAGFEDKTNTRFVFKEALL